MSISLNIQQSRANRLQYSNPNSAFYTSAARRAQNEFNIAYGLAIKAKAVRKRFAKLKAMYDDMNTLRENEGIGKLTFATFE